MGGRSPARGWPLVLAWFFVNGAALAQAPERPFFSRHPVLQFIEQRLPPAATIMVPPDPAQGRHVATDAELRAAFSRVLDDFLAPPSTFASKAGDLIGEVCRERPGQTVQWIAVATDGILKHSPGTAEKDLGDAVARAVSANPQAAGAVVGQVIRSLAAAVQAGAHPLEITAAGRCAGSAVLAAMGAVKAAPDPKALIKAIVQQAMQAATEEQANFLVMESVTAAIKGANGLESALAGELCQMAFAQFGRGKEQAGIICAGALKGAGVEAAPAVKDLAALTLPVPFAAYVTVVCDAYVAVAGSPDASQAVLHSITAANADFIPALMIGAIAANPGAAAEFLQTGLNRDLVLHGRASTAEIVAAATMACEQRAPELAAAAVGHGDLAEGNAAAQIAEGVARGALPSGIGAALAAQIKAQTNGPAETKATVAGAMAGAVAADRLHALSEIAFAAASGSGLGGDVVDQAVISAPRDLQYAGVLGAIAADRKRASVLLEHALHNRDLAPGQAGAIAAGGGGVLETQGHPLDFFRAAVSRLSARENAPAENTRAIVLAAALANPRGASAVAAAAAAATGLPPAILVTTASRGDPGARAGIAEAANVAQHLKADASDLSQFVRQRIAVNPELAPEIVTGAMTAAPSLGHVTAHAAALAAPAAMAQIIPRLFAFSAIRNPIAPQTESAPDALAALADGAIRGIRDAHLDPASEGRAIGEAVAASVKSVFAMTRGPGSGARDELLGAVIAAAARAAGDRAAEIARTAGRVARTLSGKAADQAFIKDAVLAAHPRADAAKVADAVAAGFAEADLQVPAPGAKALLDYAHDSLTQPPMTPFLDL